LRSRGLSDGEQLPNEVSVAEDNETSNEPITIKKYANRRLYNTATSSYVTLDHLCQMVKEGVEFVVYDAKTGEDITRSVLTQIIFEEESKGQNLLPINFLRQLITFYGDNLQGLVPDYLEVSMEAFARNQDQMRRYVEETFGEINPFKPLEEMGRQNMAMLQQTMNMFNPFHPAGSGSADDKADKPSEGAQQGEQGTPDRKAGAGQDGELSDLKKQLQDMQRQLDKLASKKD
jgi:polyhydroxyalkanoate synthesis repressor PhaR